MKNSRHIAFVTPVNYSYAHRVLEGVIDYVAHMPSTYFQTADYHGFKPVRRSSDFAGAGVIGVFSSYEEIAAYEQRGLVVVNVGHTLECQRRQVFVDDLRIGELAAQCFLDHGYSHFLFVTSAHFSRGRPAATTKMAMRDGLSGAFFDRDRLQGFQGILQAAGMNSQAVCLKDIIASARIWEAEWKRLLTIIRKFPRNVGIFCANDMLAHLVLDACDNAGIAIPQQIGVIGVDNDKLICYGSHPSISSIDQGEERVGRKAAELLDLILQGKEPQETIIRLDPLEVIERGSLPVTIPPDYQLRTAIVWMRQHLKEPFRIGDLVRATGLPRHQLERQFQKQLGTSPARELSRLRLEKSRRLLCSSSLSIKEIAEACGYSALASFQHAFTRHFQTTPAVYRKLNRQNLDGAHSAV